MRIVELGGHADAVPADYPALADAVIAAAQDDDRPAVIAVIGAGDLNAVVPLLTKKLEKISAGD
ncbi:hypothetical protein SDC9_131584 [bioreactor metagenome]|uniref:Uncharacterized protein n=1 Tax=bioreactor metagenome TaxID=1076179 RepID=A0A645D5J5_9ZZZZ